MISVLEYSSLLRMTTPSSISGGVANNPFWIAAEAPRGCPSLFQRKVIGRLPSKIWHETADLIPSLSNLFGKRKGMMVGGAAIIGLQLASQQASKATDWCQKLSRAQKLTYANSSIGKGQPQKKSLEIPLATQWGLKKSHTSSADASDFVNNQLNFSKQTAAKIRKNASFSSYIVLAIVM